MRVYAIGSINVLVKYGAVASLKDTPAQADVKRKTIEHAQQDDAASSRRSATR